MNTHHTTITAEGFESWLRSQDPETAYNYADNDDCVVARYARHLGIGTGPREVTQTYTEWVTVYLGRLDREVARHRIPEIVNRAANVTGEVPGRPTYGEVLRRLTEFRLRTGSDWEEVEQD